MYTDIHLLFSRAIYKLSVDSAYPVRLLFSFGSLSFQTRIYIHVVKFQNSVQPDEAAHELTHLGQRCLNSQNNKVWTKQILNFDVCFLRFKAYLGLMGKSCLYLHIKKRIFFSLPSCLKNRT